MDYLVLGGASE